MRIIIIVNLYLFQFYGQRSEGHYPAGSV